MKKNMVIYVTLEELYRAYRNCRRRKRSTHNAQEFEINEMNKLMSLYKALNNLTYKPGISIAFCVEKPVKREVFAADFTDRIVHHLVIDRINSNLEDEFIQDSYSCRKGKGTNYGIERCLEFIKEITNDYKEECYILKFDLKSFFMTINKLRLFNKLMVFLDNNYRYRNDDERVFLHYIIEQIIMNEPQKNCIRKQSIDRWEGLPKEKSLFHCEEGYGLPIGNLTSQIFANFYLSEFDHFVVEELGCKYYGRYVDDFFILIKDMTQKAEIEKRIEEKLTSMGVTLHPKKRYYQHFTKGVNFIGACIKVDCLFVSKRTKGNFYNKMVKIEEGLKFTEQHGRIDLDYIEHCVSSLNSYLGSIKNYRSFKLRRSFLMKAKFKEIYKYSYFNEELTKLTLFDEYRLIKGKKKHYTKQEYIDKKLDILTEKSLY